MASQNETLSFGHKSLFEVVKFILCLYLPSTHIINSSVTFLAQAAVIARPANQSARCFSTRPNPSSLPIAVKPVLVVVGAENGRLLPLLAGFCALLHALEPRVDQALNPKNPL